MKIIKQGIVALGLSFATATSFADVLGLSASLTFWYPELSGDIRSGGDNIDVSNDLGLGDKEAFIFTGAFEHPVPIIPNVRIQLMDSDQVAHGTVNNVVFDGQTFDGDVQTSLDLTNYDFTLYYEILDNWVNLDLGLTAKVFDGELILRAQDPNSPALSKTDIDDVIPMLYGSASFDLPITSFSAGVEGNVFSLDDDTVYDVVARLRYQFGFFGAEVGYRAMAVKIDGGKGVDVDATQDGPYLSALLLF